MATHRKGSLAQKGAKVKDRVDDDTYIKLLRMRRGLPPVAEDGKED